MQQIVSFDEMAAEKNRATYEFGRKIEAATMKDFDRVVTELAGDDHTLARVLRARLVDAHLAGYRQRWEEDNFRRMYRYSWEESAD